MQVFENFISYRRKESMLEVKNIYDALQKRVSRPFVTCIVLDPVNLTRILLQRLIIVQTLSWSWEHIQWNGVQMMRIGCTGSS